MLQKIFEIKTLKEVKIDLSYIDNNDIESIHGENTTIKKLIINWKNKKNNEIILYNLQKKFPNLTEIEVYIQLNEHKGYNPNNDHRLEINIDPNCHITKFKYAEINKINYVDVESEGTTTKFSIQSYESLEQIKFGCLESSLKLENTFPIFCENCNYIFKSLIKFEIVEKNISDLKIIKNIIANLEKMPKLKYFIFHSCIHNMDKEYYEKIIRELLLFNIKNIELSEAYINEDYSEDELKKIYKDFNLNNFEKIKINKLFQ